RSTRPGTTTAPCASIDRVASKSVSRGSPSPRAMIAILPASIAIAPWSSRSLAGSTRRAFSIRILVIRAPSRAVAGDDRHHGHPHGDAERDLRQDHALVAVDDRRVDLDAAVDRTRMHHDRVGL